MQFVKDKPKIASRVGAIKRGVVYFSKLLLVTNEEKLCNRGIKISYWNTRSVRSFATAHMSKQRTFWRV